ncbi:MAG: sigma-70 family RNA polymerase sigma factor [Verrucomicrobiota bacterium]
MLEVDQLLAEYATSGSEQAFQEVVSRYIDLVHSTALRLVNWDTHSAEDVTQRVFADLAKVAGTFSQGAMIGGWLHRHTCYMAKKLVRTELRRKAREKLAMEINQADGESNLKEIAPVLDEAINRLRAQDRQAILLRFFEQQEFSAVGQAIGGTEEAARKRVNRALEKLRHLLQKRGITLSSGALAALLASEAVNAAPVGLIVTVTSAALTTAAVGGGTATLVLQLMSMTKLQIGIVAAITVVLTVPLALQQRQKSQLQEETVALRSQLEELHSLKRENQRLSNLLARAASPSDESAADPKQVQELMKLRGEVGVLRKTASEAAAAASSRQVSPLSGVTQTPEMAKAIRDQQKLGLSIVYKDFGKVANLSSNQLEQLNEVLADDVMTNINHITALLRDGKAGEEIDRLFSQQETELHGKIKSLLGDDALTQFKDYNRNLLSHLTADQFKGMMLQGDQTSKDAAGKQLYAVLQEETQKALAGAGLSSDYQTVPTLNFRNFVSEEEGEKNIQLMDSIYEQTQARAATFLKPAEVEKFGEFRKMAVNNNRLALALNRKLMAPPGK